MAELSVSHSLRATEHYLHFNPVVSPLIENKIFLKQISGLAGVGSAPEAGQGGTRVYQAAVGRAKETQGHCSVPLWLLAAALGAVLL